MTHLPPQAPEQLPPGVQALWLCHCQVLRPPPPLCLGSSRALGTTGPGAAIRGGECLLGPSLATLDPRRQPAPSPFLTPSPAQPSIGPLQVPQAAGPVLGTAQGGQWGSTQLAALVGAVAWLRQPSPSWVGPVRQGPSRALFSRPEGASGKAKAYSGSFRMRVSPALPGTWLGDRTGSMGPQPKPPGPLPHPSRERGHRLRQSAGLVRGRGVPPACPAHGQPQPGQRGLTQSLPLSAAPKGSAWQGPQVSQGLPLSPLPPTAFATTGASSANRFVSIGPRDGNFLNIPQQSQVGGPAHQGQVAEQAGRGVLGQRRGPQGQSWSRAGQGWKAPAFARPAEPVSPGSPQAPWLIS